MSQIEDEPTDEEAPGTLRRRFREERKLATLTSVKVAGVVALIGMPSWIAFDRLVAPTQVTEFTIIRLATLAMIALAWGLAYTRVGRRRPELCGLGLTIPIQVAIALMIVELDDNHAAYAMGMTLALFASALLVAWRVRYTLILIATSALSLTVGWLLSAEPSSAAEIATVSFYVATGSAIAVLAQVLRDRAAWREFRIRARLEVEQARTRELVARLDRLSHEDALTGLANRRAWDAALSRECARLVRAGGERTLSIMLCDVDRLKEINDGLGHAMGDLVLRGVGELLAERIRASDLVARIGGDEFAVLAIDTDEGAATTLAEDIRGRLAGDSPGGPSVEVTASIGVAEWDGEDDTAEALMLRADRRLYAAKARRNVVCAGDPVEPLESS